LLEKRLFVIGFGHSSEQRTANSDQSNSTNKIHTLTGGKRDKKCGRKTGGKNGRVKGEGSKRHQATATAVSSGDDLTDFQSQPRPGQRLVSVWMVVGWVVGWCSAVGCGY